MSGGVWDELRANHAAAGSFGQGVSSVLGSVSGNVAGPVASVAGNVAGDVVGSVGSIAAGAYTAALICGGRYSGVGHFRRSGPKMADEILNRNLAGGGSAIHVTSRNALRGLRNRVRNQGGTLSIYEEDDTTIAWTAATTTAAGDPMTELDQTCRRLATAEQEGGRTTSECWIIDSAGRGTIGAGVPAARSYAEGNMLWVLASASTTPGHKRLRPREGVRSAAGAGSCLNAHHRVRGVTALNTTSTPASLGVSGSRNFRAHQPLWVNTVR